MGVRIDKWLWSMRLYKTRSIATDACKNNRVIINGTPAKPSRDVAVGDVIDVRKPPVTYTHKVKELIANRQPAKEVARYMEDITPDSEREKLQQRLTIFLQRDRGAGRPTKKERRDIDELMSEFEEFEEYDNIEG